MSDPRRVPACNRRRFLQTSSALGIGMIGATAAAARDPRGANDRLSIGMIGVGSRANAHLAGLIQLAKQYNVQVTAICDVWQKRLDRASAKIQAKWGAAPMTCTRFGDLLARDDLDGVIIATPDCTHTPIMIEALAAGKDVYVEKPMSLDVEAANRALDLAREKKAVVQVGTQRRSDGRFRAAAKLIGTGVLGTITRVSSEYNFNHARWAIPYADCKKADVDWDAFLWNQPKCDFDPKLLCRWQLYKRFTNGLPGLWMPHYADAVNMVLGTTYPSAVVAMGGKYYWKNDREHEDTFRATIEFPEGLLMSWGMGLANEAGRYWTVNGTQGTVDLEQWMLLRLGGKQTTVKDRKIEPEPTESHMGNWLSCIRTRQRPVADIEFGHQHAVAVVMAAAARDTGQRQTYDRARRAIVAG